MGELRQLRKEQNCFAEAFPASSYEQTFDQSLRGDISNPENRPSDPLARTIETEVIPRLMLAHKTSRNRGSANWQPDFCFTAADIAEFAHILVVSDFSAAVVFVDALRDRGVPLDVIFLHVFAPTARLLGQYWEADLCDFTDVAIGLSKLQQLLRELGGEFGLKANTLKDCPRAVFTAATGETHTFGLYMVEEFFRRAGWDVWGATSLSPREIIAMVRREWFAVVGFSASCERSINQLILDIEAVRNASRNRDVTIMVGGRLFSEDPELVVKIGADATAADGRQAVIQAQNLLRQAAER